MQHTFLVHVVSVALQNAAAIWFAVFVFRVHRRASWIAAATALLAVSLWHAADFVGTMGHGDSLPLDYARDVLYPLTFGVFLVSAVRLGPVFESVLRAERDARREADLRERYLDVVDDAIVTLSPGGLVMLVNRSGCEVLRRAEEDVLGRPWFETFVSEEDRERARESFARFSSDGVTDSSCEYVVLRPDGERRRVSWRRSIIRGEDGSVAAVLAAGEDVTDRRRMEQALEFDGHLLASAVDAIVVSEFDGRMRYVNDAACLLLDYSREELLRLDPFSWVAPEYESVLAEVSDVLLADACHTFEMGCVTKAGATVPVEVRAHAIDHEGRPVVVAVMRDISERKVAEETISHLAFHDTLTGLPNRRLLGERLATDIAADPLGIDGIGVFVLDVDRFKAVNEVLGHEAGDRLLMSIGTRLMSSVREGDVVGRMGGDEFLLLLHGISSRDEGETAAERIRELLRPAFDVGGQPVPCTFSIGVALRSGAEDSADQLLKNADAAMHEVKQDGRDGFRFFDPGLHEVVVDRHNLAADLRAARHNGQFELRYQPIVSGEDGRIVAAEALIRWRHPERGLVSPAAFIPMAEDTGIILDIGEWVLETACRACAEWRRAGHTGMRIAVNLSPRQLADPNLVHIVLDRLALSGLEPSALELEITETTALSDAAVVAEAFARLRAIGVRLAIDDFGTGHSSLERLKRLPIDTLKIDKTFVDDIGTSSESEAITRAILALGADLHLNIVAEGVEHADQAAYLRGAGCSELQGFHFSRPLSRRKFERLLRLERTIRALAG